MNDYETKKNILINQIRDYDCYIHMQESDISDCKTLHDLIVERERSNNKIIEWCPEYTIYSDHSMRLFEQFGFCFVKIDEDEDKCNCHSDEPFVV